MFYFWSLWKELNTGGGIRGAVCWGGGSATGATSVPSQGYSQWDACVTSVIQPSWDTRGLSPRQGGDWGWPLPSASPPCLGWHHWDSPTAPTPSPAHASCHQTLLAFWDAPVGTRAMGPSNWDDGGQGGSVLCHGDLLVKARAFGVGFPISKWLRVAPGHSLVWSDGCGQAENMLHSSHPWAEPVPQVLTFPHPKTRAQQGDLRSPWRVGFLVGISAHPRQGRPSTTAVPAHPCLHPATWGSLSNPL